MTHSTPDLVEALRARVDVLRRHVRPAPLGSIELPWRADPAVQAIEALPPKALSALVGRLLGDEEPLLAAIGVHTAFSCGNEVLGREAIDFAVERLAADDDEIFATMVVAGIGRVGASHHVEILRVALDQPATFWAAVESLALIGGDHVLGDLRRAIDAHDDHWDKLDVITVIGDVGGDFAVPVLSEILADVSLQFSPLRGYAAQALGARGDAAALPALMRALHDPTMPEKGRVLWGIARLAAAEHRLEASVFDELARWVHGDPDPAWLGDAGPKAWWRAEALKAVAEVDPARADAVALEFVREDEFFRTDGEAFSDALRVLGVTASDTGRAYLVDVVRANAELPPTSDLGATLPAWVRSRRNERLVVVALEALGAALGVDVSPVPSRRSATQEAQLQLRTLADAGVLPEGLAELVGAASDG